MTMIDTEPGPVAVGEATHDRPSRRSARMGMFALEVLPGGGVVATAALAALPMPLRSAWWWTCVALGAVAALWTASRLIVLTKPNSPPPLRNWRRRTAASALTASALCVVLAAMSHTTVGQHDRRVADARAQIAANGPRMVEQILSYDPETFHSDFDRARSLATDQYRSALSAQQTTIQKAGPVRNRYWATKSAVVAASPRDATMLLFLAGERGTLPHQRYITASVRAKFVQTNPTQWRVDRLDVVTSPQPGHHAP